jgi:hypothetical protein
LLVDPVFHDISQGWHGCNGAAGVIMNMKISPLRAPPCSRKPKKKPVLADRQRHPGRQRGHEMPPAAGLVASLLL